MSTPELTPVVLLRPFSGGGGNSRLDLSTKCRPIPAISKVCSALSPSPAVFLHFVVVSCEGGTNGEDAAAAAEAVSSLSVWGWFAFNESCAPFVEGLAGLQTPFEGTAGDWSKSAASRRYACRSARAVRRSIAWREKKMRPALALASDGMATGHAPHTKRRNAEWRLYSNFCSSTWHYFTCKVTLHFFRKMARRRFVKFIPSYVHVRTACPVLGVMTQVCQICSDDGGPTCRSKPTNRLSNSRLYSNLVFLFYQKKGTRSPSGESNEAVRFPRHHRRS